VPHACATPPSLTARGSTGVTAKALTVVAAQPSTVCLGTQVGRLASSSGDLATAGGCNPLCQAGPGTAPVLCGTSVGVPTYCCYQSLLRWTAAATTVTAYPYVSLPIPVPAVAHTRTRLFFL
jgi:hypothetical protein